MEDGGRSGVMLLVVVVIALLAWNLYKAAVEPRPADQQQEQQAFQTPRHRVFASTVVRQWPGSQTRPAASP